MNNRDNFSEKIKRQLRDSVANCCSNPDCRKSTTAPNVNIGEAAHIKAASPNGPRYDATQTKEERSSIENAIWLCNTCAKIIDSDVENYPVEKLNEWKRNAELRAKNNLAKPFYTEHEHTLNKLHQFGLMTGIQKTDNLFELAKFPQNIIQALHQEFKELDPNIDVYPIIKHDDIDFSINGEVKLNVSVKGKSNVLALKQLFEYGYMDSTIDGSIDFPSLAIKKIHEMKGMPLDKIDGKISIQSNKRFTCTSDLIFVNKSGHEIWEISSEATLYTGQKGFTFVISLYNKLINLIFNEDFDNLDNSRKRHNKKISIEINHNYILDKPILSIKNLEFAVKFLRLLLDKDNKVNVKIKSEYGTIMNGSLNAKTQKERDFIHAYFYDLNIIFMLQKIANHTNQNLIVKNNFGDINEKIYNDIRNCFRAITGNYSEPYNQILEFELQNPQLDNFKGVHLIQIHQTFQEPLLIMNQELHLPNIIHTFTKVQLRKIKNIENALLIQIKPSKGCLYQLMLDE